MKIQQINSGTSFQAKRKFLSNDAKEELQIVLNDMNSETKYSEKGGTFESSILKRINITNDKGETGCLEDKRWNVAPFYEQTPKGTSRIKGKNFSVVIDNQTGEITNIEKPFYKTKKSIIAKVENFISTAYHNFANKQKVEYKFINIAGFTRTGWSAIEKARDAAMKACKKI